MAGASESKPMDDVNGRSNSRAAARFRAELRHRDAVDGALASDSFLRPSFTLEQLRTFLAVASREHVTHAAQVLGLSQPAVTQQIQLLERALGVPLLERIGRNIRLTGAGLEVAGACLLIMRALENLDGVVAAVRGLDLGSVTVGASYLAANYFLPSVITEYAAKHPRIKVTVVIGEGADVCQQVAAGELECGLVDGAPTPGDTNLVQSRVAATDVYLVANSQHAAGGTGDPGPEGVFHGARQLVWGPGSAIEAIAVEMLGEHYEPTRRLDVGTMEAARRSLLNSPGFIAAMPAIAVCDDLGSGSLVRLCANSVPLPVFAVRRRGPDAPAVEALWHALTRKAGLGVG
jgi:DNA-binding transcriptional LysR family regulator